MTDLCECSISEEQNKISVKPDLPEGIPPLRAFYLYMSDSCNLRCRHCWITPNYVNGRPSPGDTIDMELLRSAVREAKPMGLSSAKLTGGEPMLHPCFMDIADMLTGEGLRLSMETNGTLITAESAKHLKEKTAVDFISISLDGADPETHDAFRGVPGAFDAAITGMRHLVSAGYKNVQAIMCVHRGNVNMIEDIIKVALENGASSLKLNPVTRGGRGSRMHEKGEALSFEERLELSSFIYGELQKRSPIRVIMNSPPALTSIPEIMRKNGHTGDCGVRGILGILGSGDIALCGIGRTIPELVYGRLGRDSIRDIWLGNPLILKMRKDLDDIGSYPALCRACVHVRTCRTGCVAHNYVESRQLIWPNIMCEEAAKRNVFPASRIRPGMSL